MNVKWKKLSANCEILEHEDGKGFYVTYNYYPATDTSETTIIRKSSYNCTNKQYYILKGDHRAPLEELFKGGYKPCIEYYYSFPARDPNREGHKKLYQEFRVGD